MKKTLAALFVLALCASPFAMGDDASDKAKTTDRLNAATEVMKEIMATPDKSIPSDLLDKSYCAVIVPGVKKGAFIVGARYGRGFVTCRGPQGRGWGAPGAVRVEGGSFGFQIGGEETDVVMLVMNKSGAQKLLATKFTLGGEGSVAAGPVGRTTSASTDAAMHAEILTWNRSRGVFGGISLAGATLRPDDDANQALYGSKVSNSKVVLGNTRVPAPARPLIALLTKYSAREK